jgi:Fe-S-cluster containining protein
VLEAVHRITATLHLPCTALCDGRCERMDHEETVLLLPYEMEYVTEKGGLRGSPFDVIAIDGLDCGLMGFTREYPCLGQKGCAIYEFRPLDCRSFPIIPYFRPDGSIEFYLAPYCPLKDTLPLEFVSGLTSCWRQLSPVLSWSWKSYYNSLSKYTYRLQEAGPAVEA